MVTPSLEAADILARDGISASVVNCRFIKPLDEVTLERLFPAHDTVLTIEEGTVVNGFGTYVRGRIHERWSGVRSASLGMPDAFMEHGSRKSLLRSIGLDAEGIAERARSLVGTAAPARVLESA